MYQKSEPPKLSPTAVVLIKEKALLVVVIAILCFLYLARVPFSKALIQFGNAQISAQHHFLARTSYELAVLLNGDLKEAVDKCAAYNTQQLYQQAIAACSKAIELEPNYAWAYFSRGNAYLSLMKYDQSIADFTKDIELIPVATRSYINRGAVYLQQKKYDMAIAEFTQSIEINSNEAQAWLNRGLAYIEQGQSDLAVADCQKAVALETQYWRAYFCLGLAFSNQGDYEAAIDNYSKAAELAPDIHASLVSCMQGVTYTQKGDFAAAIVAFEEGLQRNVQFENDGCKTALENARKGIPTR